jgi:hypothetical protein
MTVDPFTVPQPTGTIAAADHRARVVLAGMVIRAEPARWVGGRVLEVDLQDLTGTIRLAFMGRHEIAGVEAGTVLTAAGTVGRHVGHAVILNPQVWLQPANYSDEVGQRAGRVLAARLVAGA